ncbi:MAG TPA: hypothetical protein VHS76_01850 [Steroidobacteraceae bacterium]|nr:hypothetical protein [Steroidobacteraceae bacterium]
MISEIAVGLKSRRFKEAAAITLCVVSAVGGWYDLERGATFGNEVSTIACIWIFANCWLTGRWPLSKAERNRTLADIYNAAKAGRLPRETILERVISWGSIAFILMSLYWIFSGAWLS